MTTTISQLTAERDEARRERDEAREEMRAECDALSARVAALEAALRPFAEIPLVSSTGAPLLRVRGEYADGSGWLVRPIGQPTVAVEQAVAALAASPAPQTCQTCRHRIVVVEGGPARCHLRGLKGCEELGNLCGRWEPAEKGGEK